MKVFQKYLLYFFVLIVVLFSFTPAFSQSKTLVRRIRFAKGQSSAIVNGRMRTNDYIDYRFDAREGQTATVYLKTHKGKMRFLVGAVQGPGPYKGSNGVSDWEGILPITGTHLIILYIESKSASYTLELTVH